MTSPKNAVNTASPEAQAPEPEVKASVTEVKSAYTKISFWRKHKKVLVGAAAIISIAVIACVGFVLTRPTNQDANYTTPGTISVTREPFATVVLEDLNVNANIPAYNLGDDFANVINFKRFEFTDSMKSQLAANKFIVVQPDADSTSRIREEFFQIYETNRYAQIPNFITTDAILHNYHLVFDDMLKSLETTIFSDKVKAAVSQMFEASKEQYATFSTAGNEKLTQAATRNVAYFAVALKLFGEEIQVPDYVTAVVDSELAKIEAAAGIDASPIINLFTTLPFEEQLKEDYTQYIPRGHYTANNQLKKYFKAAMWLGRITFRQKVESENLSALLMVTALNSKPEALKSWSDMYDTIGFIIGETDDLGVYEYTEIANNSFGTLTNENLANAEAQQAFIAGIQLLAPPKINSIPIFDESINPDKEAEIKGFRFMGQRYTLDANIFQNLVYRSVKENSQTERRMLPKSLDILAAMGSEQAQAILDSEGVNDFPNYSQNMNDLKQLINGFTNEYWTSNLYNGWLFMIKPLVAPVGEGYPEFMRNTSWIKKDMNTYQASWTELKHDTLLYTKQSYAEAGGGPPPTPLVLDDRGYVEPRADIYARLEALANALNSGLNERGLLTSGEVTFTEPDPSCPQGYPQDRCFVTTVFNPQVVKENISDMASMASMLKTISLKELANTELSDEEYTYIKEVGARFEHTWETTLHKAEELRIGDRYDNLTKNPAMLVADVATDPNGSALEEGTGRLMDIYVLIPTPGVEGSYRVAHGLVSSHYEFVVPVSGRLTDQEWQSKVRDNDVPAFESWKDFIIPKSEVTAKPGPVSYKNLIDNNWSTLEQAQISCERMEGTFIECGNPCPETNLSCGMACEPICRTY